MKNEIQGSLVTLSQDDEAQSDRAEGTYPELDPEL